MKKQFLILKMRVSILFFNVAFLSMMTNHCAASGSGKYSNHSSQAHSYNLGVHSSGTSDHHVASAHTTGSSAHTKNTAGSYYYSNPKSSYHSSIVGNSTYFRANKNPPKHSKEEDKYSSDKKAKADKEAKTPEAPAKVQHTIDPFKPKPRPKPGTYTPAAPTFIQPN